MSNYITLLSIDIITYPYPTSDADLASVLEPQGKPEMHIQVMAILSKNKTQ